MRNIRLRHAVPAVSPRVLGLALAVGAAVLGGCGGLNITSVWRDRDVVIDGVPAEWEGTSTWVENPNVAVGVMNDSQYLYLCFSTPVRGIAAEVIHGGLTVWFDPKGRLNKTFGIRCPVGFRGAPGHMGASPGAEEAHGTPEGTPRERSGGAGAWSDSARVSGMSPDWLRQAAGELQVIRPDRGDTLTLAAAQAGGIQVMLGYDSGRLVYELRVPLESGSGEAYGIGYVGGGKIGVGFETPQPTQEMQGWERGRRRPPPGGGVGEPGGGDGSPGGGSGGDNDDWGEAPGGSGGREGGMRREMEHGGPGASAEPVEIWGTIHLAIK
jgi:hypothetical protein